MSVKEESARKEAEGANTRRELSQLQEVGQGWAACRRGRGREGEEEGGGRGRGGQTAESPFIRHP